MSIRRVLSVLFLIGIFMGPIAGAGIWNAHRIAEAASSYRQTTFTVTGSNCIGGQVTRNSDGTSSTSPVHCFLEGTVDGTAEELPVGQGDDATYPSGTDIAVWYAPELPAFGVNYQARRVLFDLGDTPAASAERTIAMWSKLLMCFALSVVLLELLYDFTVRPFWRLADPNEVAVGEDAPAVGLGLGLAAFGLTFLLLGALGGKIFGAVLLAIGVPICMRRVHRVDRTARTLSTRRGLWPILLAPRTRELADPVQVAVEQSFPGSAVSLILETDRGPVTLRSDRDLARVVGLGRDLAAMLGVTLEERWPSDETGRVMDAAAQLEGLAAARRTRTFRAVVKLALLAMVVAAVVGFLKLPPLNAPVMLRVLGRELPRLPTPVRVYAVGQLGRPGASDAAVLELARVANTADPEYEASLAAAALAALESIAGGAFAGEEPVERLRAANAWAAERLGRELDANGGVLTWYPPVARFASLIEGVASVDPNDGWMSWSGFGAGDFRSSRDFAAAVGSGLADARPISFAIKRGSFWFGATEDAPAFEGQPEPIAQYGDQVLVRTVGGALALRMWEYDDVPGDTLPDDFVAWWNDFAASRLYPPLPEP